MTTIVYRDGVLVSDSRAYSGRKLPIGSKDKIHRLSDGSLVGVSTTLPGLSDELIAWFEAGADTQDLPDCSPSDQHGGFVALRIMADGEVFYYQNRATPSGPLRAAFFAIGSGEEYALGALEAGAGAREAVEIACKLDPWSGFPIRELELDVATSTDSFIAEPLES